MDRLAKAKEYVKERRKKLTAEDNKFVYDEAMMRSKMGARWGNIQDKMEERYKEIDRYYEDEFRKNQEVLKKTEDEIYKENRERIQQRWWERAQAAGPNIPNPRYGDFRRKNGELEMWTHNPIRLSNGSYKRGMWRKVQLEAPKEGKAYGRVITNADPQFRLDPRNDPTLQTSTRSNGNRNRNRYRGPRGQTYRKRKNTRKNNNI